MIVIGCRKTQRKDSSLLSVFGFRFISSLSNTSIMNVNRHVLTLDEFTIQQLRQFPQATGELSSLLRDIGLAAKRVNVEVNKAGLVDILGDAGSVNVQGEDVKKLDIYANNQFMGVLQQDRKSVV